MLEQPADLTQVSLGDVLGTLEYHIAFCSFQFEILSESIDIEKVSELIVEIIAEE